MTNISADVVRTKRPPPANMYGSFADALHMLLLVVPTEHVRQHYSQK